MTLYRAAAEAVAGYAQQPKLSEISIADERAAAQEAAAAEPREVVATVEDVDANGVRCRLYRPADARPGLVVHVHGGGFVFHDIDVHDAAVRRFANRAGLSVLSVDYRRPPEDRFPSAVQDVDAVVAWLEGRDQPGPLFVHGDSAGGNLALVAALRHPGRFTAAALIYPFLDPSQGFDSYDTAADGFDREEAAWYWQQYAADPTDLTDPDLAPLLSDRLGTLPPTLVVTAEHDPLRDEGEELARRLDARGVDVTATRYLGQVHGFWRGALPASDRLMRQVSGFLAAYS
ncbi:alpha/beta hydrolase [Nocardioides sp. BP30]|uniref:alpha/beta hydrolase n=1 Tax=Nocardioides sp. BP30 TaxID=3036374 RepID=UPI0024685018|nr:alpha/beta hydrolase [Nocardioides sp. BP30]WGL53558.1 alpha/beta hydrolase [Nocardioides sp. BP30]